MAQAKEIRSKISSVKKTRKITSAMELVAASKMRKAQLRMKRSKPYATIIRRVIAHIAAASSEYKHSYLEEREERKNIGLIIVSTDRGLCGGLNVNLFKKSLEVMQQWDSENINIELSIIGQKGESFFRYHGAKILGIAKQLGDAPSVADLIGVVKLMLDKYDEGGLDALYVISNDFVNSMVQKPELRQLLPLVPDEAETGYWDYIYEPDSAKDLLEQLLKRYIESQVYQAVIENIACFQAAQMVAMKSATDNASDIIDELQMDYNKVRQASITQEIAEIVGGAAAIE